MSFFKCRNYFISQIQEAAKLKPTEAELRRLEDLSEDIVKDFSIMRKNEEEMRNTNGNLTLLNYFIALISSLRKPDLKQQ